jgi:hypothetical protein
MASFWEDWLLACALSLPFIVSVLITIFWARKNNLTAYKIGWFNLLFFFFYSIVFTLVSDLIYNQPGQSHVYLVVAFSIGFFSFFQLIIFWVWVSVKPKKLSETTEKTNTQKDPILDEEPPKQA